jgi:hypothetical protein
VTRLELLTLDILITFIYYATLRHYDLSVGANAALGPFSLLSVFESPKFDHSIISRQHLESTAFVVHKLDGVDFLIQLD